MLASLCDDPVPGIVFNGGAPEREQQYRAEQCRNGTYPSPDSTGAFAAALTHHPLRVIHERLLAFDARPNEAKLQFIPRLGKVAPGAELLSGCVAEAETLRPPAQILTLASLMTNYMTPEGAKRLSSELDRLMRIERPRVVQQVAEAAAQGDRSENAEYIYGKRRLREIDRRVRFLRKRLESAEVVKPGTVGGDRVRFGAMVTVEDENGKQSRYCMVGPDESNPSQGLLSFQSPLGRALLNKQVGDSVTVQRPAGDIEVQILQIEWEA